MQSSHTEIRNDNIQCQHISSFQISTIQTFHFPLQSMEVRGSNSYVDKQWPHRTGFFQWMKVIFHSGLVHNKQSRLCQRLASRIFRPEDTHHISQKHHNCRCPMGPLPSFIPPSIHPSSCLSDPHFLPLNIRFRWAFSGSALAVTHSFAKSNRKNGGKKNQK